MGEPVVGAGIGQHFVTQFLIAPDAEGREPFVPGEAVHLVKAVPELCPLMHEEVVWRKLIVVFSRLEYSKKTYFYLSLHI